jgi:PhzF family phenazine biosynthesis protein
MEQRNDHPLFHVDAFTDRPFADNPAAVCILPSWKEDGCLQAVARNMNLSETAFLVKQHGHFDLRWFTPKVEFWRKRLGKTEFVAFQASARGRVVKVRVTKARTFLGGKVVTVAMGELLVEEDVS